MPRESYRPKDFREATWKVIRQANSIIAEYQAAGFQLTLRQLYYQFVARDLLPNKQSEYKRLGDILNDARLAGAVDWNAIIDRTRNLKTSASWELDALDPRVIHDLIDAEVTSLIDDEAWREALEAEESNKADLQLAADRWSDVVTRLKDNDLDKDEDDE